MKSNSPGSAPQARHAAPGSTEGGNGHKTSSVVADLVFRGMDLCDMCGGPLPPADRLSGLCGPCQVSPQPKPAERRIGARMCRGLDKTGPSPGAGA